MDPIVLQEISRRSIVIGKIFGGCVKWGHSPLAVLTDKGISIFDYTYKISSAQKKIALVEFSLPCKKTSPASEVFPAQFSKHIISAINYNQMLIDPSLWPHSTELMNELAAVTSFQWSPPQLQFHNNCILATVTNVGNIELYGRQRCGWDSILDLSELIKQYYNLKAPGERIQSIEDLETLKRLALTLESSSSCWCPDVSQGTNCYLVSAQKNGDLLFWMIASDNEDLKADLVLKHETKVGEIISLQWIPLSDKHFLLTYANLLGQLFGLECTIQDGAITTIRTVCLWVYQDRMVVKHIKCMSYNDKLVILYTKHRNLIVQTLHESLTVLSQCQKNVNQSKITNLTQNKDNFYISTVTGKIYRVIINFSQNNLDIEFSLIRTKDAYETSELYGFDISKNSAIWAVCWCDRNITNRKYQKVDIVFLVVDDKKAEIHALLHNPSNSLQEMWDCLELLRYKCAKLRSLPQFDLDQLYAEAETDIYKLKLYLQILFIYKSDEVIAIVSKSQLPETSVEKVKETILLMHAQMLRAKLSNMNYQTLEGMDMESFTFASKYIAQYCQKYKICMIEDYEKAYRSIEYSIPKYKCESCDGALDGFICRNGHMNMFCTITFTPILGDDYIYCKGCDATARIELYSNKVTCTFCDIPLDKFE